MIVASVGAMVVSLFSRVLGPRPDVLAAARSGDRKAIAEFYDSHVDGLYAFVLFRVGRDATLAEDIVQETFTVALSRSEAYDPVRGSIGTWLTVLSRNVIRDHLRAHRRSSDLAATWDRIDATLAQTFASLAERPLPGEVLERAETRDLVHMAIANLPEQYRTALTRKYCDGVSLETLAGELGVSVDAA